MVHVSHVTDDEQWGDDDNAKQEFDDACGASLCCIAHTARVPDEGCVGTWFGVLNGAVLLFSFAYVLRKIFRSNRRARAGYTKNTISLDTHVSVFEGVLVWAVTWGLLQVFSFKDATMDLPPPYLGPPARLATTAATTAVVHGASEAFGMLILLLLVTGPSPV